MRRIHYAVYRCPGTKELAEIHSTFGIPSFFRLASDDIWAQTAPVGIGEYKL
jgi:hypothetical protein